MSCSSYDIDWLCKCVRKFQEEIMVNGRYLSWEHCYLHFQNNRHKKDEAAVDLMALNLGFYLASLGMMRGSSFLSQLDYKVHIPIIDMLIKKEYESLSEMEIEKMDIELVIKLKKEIAKGYNAHYMQVRNYEELKKKELARDENWAGASDVLVTKILLGTHCCTPAYDQYYMDGIKKYFKDENKPDKVAQQFGMNSLKGIIDFYKQNMEQFEAVRNTIFFDGTNNEPYPPMKIIDMAFWELGSQIDEK